MSRRPSFSRRAALAAAIVTAVTGLAACGSNDTPAPASPGAASASGSFPATVTDATGAVTIAAAPKRIVSLSPTATEMLYAIGAGSAVVAVDDQSNYPAQAPKTKLSGFQPNAEAVAGYSPDLVVYADDLNGLTAGLKTLKLTALQLPAATTLDDAYAQLTTLGKATGHPQEAGTVVTNTKTALDKAAAAMPPSQKPLTVYHELDKTYYSATSKTFIGAVYTKLGLKNIADGAPKAAGDYPQLSAEFVAQQNPDVVVLADGTSDQQTPQTFAARPAFGSLNAVKNGHVLVVNADIASRWGPRVADFAQAVANDLKQ